MRRRRRLSLMAVVALLSGGHAGAAAAHTHLADLRPEPEVTVAAPPRAVQLVFSQPVDVVGNAAGMRSAGREVGVDVLRRAGGRLVLLRPRTPLRAGRVDVRFRVLSQDGHVLRGRYGFRVRAGAVARADALHVSAGGSGASTTAAVVHGLHHLLFVLAAGLVLCGPLVLGACGVAWPAGALRAICLLAAAASLLAASLTWAAADGASALRALLPGSVASAAGTSAGGAWLLRAGLWVLAAALATRPTLVLGSVLAAIAASLAVSGHAGTHGGAGSVVVDAAHLLAAGAWLGGIVVLALAARRPGADRARGTQAFARVAGIAFGVLLATGIVNGVLRLGGLDALDAGGYGRLVLVKLALAVAIAAVAAAGLRARRSGVSAATTLQLRSELVLGGAALVIAAILVESAPPS